MQVSQYKTTHPSSVPVSRHEATFVVGRERSHVQMTPPTISIDIVLGLHHTQGSRKNPRPDRRLCARTNRHAIQGLFIVGFNPAAILVNPNVTKEAVRLSKKPLDIGHYPDTTAPFKICPLNIRSYLEHHPDLRIIHQRYPSAIYCFTETFLTSAQL